MVDVRLVRKLPRLVSLAELRDDPALVDLPLVRRGTRLSVMPVPEAAWRHIVHMAGG
jgi:predicted RNA-binding protein with PUA-like domain